MGKPEIGAHLLEYDSNDNPLYEGWALHKSVHTHAAVWKIKRYTWTTGTGGTQVMTEEAFAHGNELYDNIWDNRALLTYGVAV